MYISLPNGTLYSSHFIVVDQITEDESRYSPSKHNTSTSRSNHASWRQLSQSSLSGNCFIYLLSGECLEYHYIVLIIQAIVILHINRLYRAVCFILL